MIPTIVESLYTKYSFDRSIAFRMELWYVEHFRFDASKLLPIPW